MHELASVISEKYVALLKHYSCNFESRRYTTIVLVLAVPQLHKHDPFHFLTE